MADEITPAPMELPTPAPTPPDDGKTPDEELREVQIFMDEWKSARAFDRTQLLQMSKDRKYVSGVAGNEWAVNANLLGSYVDILTSFIYARNPKCSIRPAEQAGDGSRRERQIFAETLQIVVQRLWTQGKLKKAMKKAVRAGFSVSCGWIKAVMLVDTERDPLIETELNNTKDNLEAIAALEGELVSTDTKEPVDRDVVLKEIERQVEALESNLEIVIGKTFAIDFVASESVQVSLDVRDIDDYLEAGWMANESFVRKSELRGKYPRLSDDDIKTATIYYQKQPTEYAKRDTTAIDGAGSTIGDVDPHHEASQYTTDSPTYAGSAGAGVKGLEFCKVIEAWHRTDLHITTSIEGVKKWAKEPFLPMFTTSRYYPYFMVSFFPVDGERWPQSLTYRLFKLQDEYAGARSSFRLTRQRAIPGTIFNATVIEDLDAKKLASASHDEFIPIKPRNQDADMRTLFAEKPVPRIDVALFTTDPIVGDMEKISGVQEALQTSQTMDKTATQAKIEERGFSARSTAERDCVEEMLDDFALYTAQLALGALKYQDVVKIAGPLAYWPENLPTESIVQMLDVEIEAGSTARPNADQEREDWVEIMPVIQNLAKEIISAPGTPWAVACTALLRETLRRFDDRMDLDTFVPGASMTAGGLSQPPPSPMGPDPYLSGRDPNTGLPIGQPSIGDVAAGGGGGGGPSVPGLPPPGAGELIPTGATDPLAGA